MRYVYLVTAFVAVVVVSLFGFRGSHFKSPPMDVFPEWAFPGMKRQPKYKPQAPSEFFADGRADRPIPAGTVARGDLREDDRMFVGKNTDGSWVRGYPSEVTVDMKFIEHGKERYTIYCAPCHGLVGDGNGVTKKYGMATTPSYHDDRLRNMAEGELYNTITVGSPSKLMLPYADKLTPDERWAVVAYVRALQRAQTGKATDVADPAGKNALGLK